MKKFLTFSQKKTFLIFSKRNFIIFWERYIQNPNIFRTRSIFRTRGIFRTLSSIYDGIFCKNSCLVHFSAQARKIKINPPQEKFLYFTKMELSDSNIKKNSYVFSKESFSYLAGNAEKETLFRRRNFLIIQETETLKNFPK